MVRRDIIQEMFVLLVAFVRLFDMPTLLLITA